MTDFETNPIGTTKRIEALTEQLAAAREDAREAEDYAKEVEADRKKTYEALLKVSRIHGEVEAKLAKVIAILHHIVDQRGYADDPWGIVQSALAELKGGTNGKD